MNVFFHFLHFAFNFLWSLSIVGFSGSLSPKVMWIWMNITAVQMHHSVVHSEKWAAVCEGICLSSTLDICWKYPQPHLFIKSAFVFYWPILDATAFRLSDLVASAFAEWIWWQEHLQNEFDWLLTACYTQELLVVKKKFHHVRLFAVPLTVGWHGAFYKVVKREAKKRAVLLGVVTLLSCILT